MNSEINLYIDILTGLPNFFRLVELDTRELFGEKGNAIILDMAQFAKINEDHGRGFGDLCLKTLSQSINSALIEIDNGNVFRTDGDEFTIIIQNITLLEADKLTRSILRDFKNQMKEYGYPRIDVHNLIVSYSSEITSINQFYHLLFQKSLEEAKLKEDNIIQEKWVERVITSFIKRIKDTLTLLNDAYNLALTDDISCLQNNRAAKLYLSKLISESIINRQKIGLLFIDGDNLKKYNEIGYEAGNDMIRRLSHIISSSLRKNDKVFRWLSGDEFIVVLENTDLANTLRLAERIRLAVEVESGEWIFPITVSIGVASFPDDGLRIEELLDKAERANFRAKQKGKNQVV